MKNEKSFTLIELLVVIAIIGLLAAVVLVSTGGIQSKAKITKTLEFSQSVQRTLGAYAVGIWSFDDQANPTKDGSGYGNNGIVNGATFSSDTPHAAIDRGTGKYALSFDGVDDYVDAGTIATFADTKEWTAEAWIKPINDGWNTILGQVSTVLVTYLSSGITFYSGNSYSVNIGSSVNTWSHIVATMDTSRNFKVYRDGVYKGVATPPNSAFSPRFIGTYGPSVDMFNGLMDEVRIYEKALTLGEIQKHYAEGLERHKDLVLY